MDMLHRDNTNVQAVRTWEHTEISSRLDPRTGVGKESETEKRMDGRVKGEETRGEAEGGSLDTSGAETFKSDCHRETQKTV